MLFAGSAELRDDGESAEFYERVADQIKEYGGVGCGGAGFCISRQKCNRSKGYQDISGVRDGAVGQHALDVGLHQRAEIPDKHGEPGEDPESPEPEMGCGRNGGEDAQEQSERRRFGSSREERSYWRGSTFIHIGRPDLKGREGYLKAETDENEG